MELSLDFDDIAVMVGGWMIQTLESAYEQRLHNIDMSDRAITIVAIAVPARSSFGPRILSLIMITQRCHPLLMRLTMHIGWYS